MIENYPIQSRNTKLYKLFLEENQWNSNLQQSVTLPGIVADPTKQLIHILPSLVPGGNSESLFKQYGISCTGQEDNALVFTAKEKPPIVVEFYVSVQRALVENISGLVAYEWWSPKNTQNNDGTAGFKVSGFAVSPSDSLYYAIDGRKDTWTNGSSSVTATTMDLTPHNEMDIFGLRIMCHTIQYLNSIYIYNLPNTANIIATLEFDSNKQNNVWYEVLFPKITMMPAYGIRLRFNNSTAYPIRISEIEFLRRFIEE